MRGNGPLPGAEAPHVFEEACRFPAVEAGLQARSGDGIVFLDLEADEYACCYDARKAIGPYCSCMPEGGGLDDTHPVLIPYWMDVPQDDFPPPGMIDLARFLIAITNSAWRFRRRSVADLASVVASFGKKKRPSTMTVQQAANLFRHLLSLVPFNPECLFRSFALLHFLEGYGLRADWVFGVQLFPFRAHCWVAVDHLLLNERKHAIEDYEVIWTVGEGMA
jgi:hypothetical protein